MPSPSAGATTGAAASSAEEAAHSSTSSERSEDDNDEVSGTQREQPSRAPTCLHARNDVGRLTRLLCVGARQGRVETVRSLLADGARCDVLSGLDQQMGAMEMAVRGADPSAIVPVLVAAGCSVGPLLDPSDRDSECAPLDVLAASRRVDVVPAITSLIAAGADVNHRNRLGPGLTALDGAAHTGNIDVVNALIHEGADVTLVGDAPQCRTALHWAASELSGPVCAALLSAGADVDARDGDGQTALQLAATAVMAMRRALIQLEAFQPPGGSPQPHRRLDLGAARSTLRALFDGVATPPKKD